MNIKFEDIGAFGIVVGIIGAAYGIYQAKKSGDVARKLDISLSDLEKRTPVEIREDMVNKVAREVITREAKIIVSETADNVRSDLKKDIRQKVNKEIESELDNIHEDVDEKIHEMVDNIDEEKFLSDVKAEAKKAMLAKYNGALDGILADFKDRFKDVNGIFNYVAGCLAPRQGYPGNGTPRFFDFGG